MNGPHDLGGQMGFGPVAPEPAEPLFHEPWEARVLAMSLAMGATGSWNIDMSRHARERIPPAEYLASSYYRIWFLGLCRLLEEKGLASRTEISFGKPEAPPSPVNRVLTADKVAATLLAGNPADRRAATPPRFAVGQQIRTLNIHPETHTRLPRYARGRKGEIAGIHGCHVFPDSSAGGKGDDPRWLYAVRFTAGELWGKHGPDSVVIDLWEPYLEAR